MALEPSLWGTLPKELLHLVFARLPVAGIGQLRVLSKEWKRNIDSPQRKMKLPPLLSMGAGKSDVRVKMVQLTMDRKAKEYKLHVVVGYTKTGGNGLMAQVYDSHINGWSVVESREGRLFGWEHLEHCLYTLGPSVYNFADGNLRYFNPSDIAPGLSVDPDCIELINYHLFVLHKEAPPSSTNLIQDGESISGTYCISEFHLPETATTWVKLGVHDCDPSICDSLEGDYELSLLACNGFLLVYPEKYDRAWLYNLSTCAWRNLPELELPFYRHMVLCEISWSALP